MFWLVKVLPEFLFRPPAVIGVLSVQGLALGPAEFCMREE